MVFTKREGRVAVLFSGGDSPGMNPFLRYFVRLGLHEHGMPVLGIKDGYAGLVRAAHRVEGESNAAEVELQLTKSSRRGGLSDRRQDVLALDHRSVSGLCGRGGIALGAARCPAFHSPRVRARTARFLRDVGVDALVTVGGNGTLAGAQRLAAECDLQVIGIPATIDNDLPCTETALGFDTAVNSTMRALEAINDTAASHHRIIVVQTMGRDCGSLARAAALAAGAEIVVAPERGMLTAEKAQGIARRLEHCFASGQTHAIVAVAEGIKEAGLGNAAPAAALRNILQAHFAAIEGDLPPVEVRDVVLGHLQRGGCPSAADRLLAARLANGAWDAIMGQPPRSGVVAVQRGRMVVHSFADPLPVDFIPTSELDYQIHKAVSDWE